ncbi:MAG TPA: YifB family Mg chelatase-like AAA ATPase [Anaerolineales bacterium]|nr:YifB family Mg chelatase-like AAA ATPase [Anaerolineales bacterium]
MFTRTYSCAVSGIEGEVVEVEVDHTNGLPGITIVGLPDTAVQESRERVQTAIRNAGFFFPRQRIVVNLAPASIRKEGSNFDLPIALGILILCEDLEQSALNETLVIGELSLNGTIRHSRGILPMAIKARELGYRRIVVPDVDAAEACLVPDIQVLPANNLRELVKCLSGQQDFPKVEILNEEQPFEEDLVDFSEIKGQEYVKRALEVAAAGGHNILMVGSPGSGKTLMARALPGILPDLSIEEALDVTRIYSVADMLPNGSPLVRKRPFRSPHHTISNAGLVGGGQIPHPGEISLAHRGVLFLDEFPEFGARVLEVLRQPMEDKVVTISRAQGTLTFLANFQLVAAMNPCPCGFYGDPVKACSCSTTEIIKYQKRISGPILDRIDLHISVSRVDQTKLASEKLGERSEMIKQRVENARAIQAERLKGTNIMCNADMRVVEIRQFCKLQPEGQDLLKIAMNQLNLSARAYHRILKLARTIADLANSETIETGHIAESLQYRPKLMQSIL